MSQHVASRILSSLRRGSVQAFLFLSLLSSCSSPSPTSPTIATETSIPTSTEISPTEAPLLTETPTAVPTLTPELERPLYVLDLQLDYSSKAAVVNQTITYPNWTGETLTNLILAVEPNLWSGGFSLKSLAVDDQPIANYTIGNANQKLEIPLPQPLPPSGTVTITMNYGLILPQMQAYSNPNEVRPQIYGFSDRQINFVDWYPFVVPYIPG